MRRERFVELMLVALAAHVETGKAPVLPAGGELAWRWFTEIRLAKDVPQPIGWPDLAAYRAMAGWLLRPDHCQLIMAMDRRYLECMSKKSRPPPDARMVPKPNMNAEVFDAMFG